ncbi:MAG TPA: pilus assembly protein PilM [Smithella sp.]|nr:pilus assembly protein PilM [Smithella sp.]
MPQTILGLDIGTDTIKAIVLSSKGLTGGRIISASNLDINACGGIEPALKKLAEDKTFSNIPCCLSLPLTDIMFRQVRLPFHDDNKIRKTLAFELEPLIPVPIEEVVADYLMIPGDGLLVAALAKNTIRDWIEKVEGILGEVSIIDTSPTALAARIIDSRKTAACGMILDIGHDSTTAAFYEDDAIVHVRLLAFGGRHITASLAAELSVNMDRAEQLKISGNYPEAALHAGDTCRNFCSELKNTIEYMKLTGVLRNEPAQIITTGGGSLFIPLRKELEDYFSCSVEALDLIRSKQLDIEENIRSQFDPPIMNTAIAAAMRMSAGRKSFNFRQGEFAANNASFNFKDQLKWVSWTAGIIIFLAIVNQFLDYGLKTQHLNNIKKQIAHIFKENIPEAKSMIDPVQQLKTKLAENKKTLGFYEGLPEVTTVDLLKEISGIISPSLNIVITDLNYENSMILIKGEAKTIDEVSAVKNDLLKSRYFKNVTMGSTSLTKDGGKVNFNLRIDVK